MPLHKPPAKPELLHKISEEEFRRVVNHIDSQAIFEGLDSKVDETERFIRYTVLSSSTPTQKEPKVWLSEFTLVYSKQLGEASIRCFSEVDFRDFMKKDLVMEFTEEFVSKKFKLWLEYPTSTFCKIYNNLTQDFIPATVERNGRHMHVKSAFHNNHVKIKALDYNNVKVVYYDGEDEVRSGYESCASDVVLGVALYMHEPYEGFNLQPLKTPKN